MIAGCFRAVERSFAFAAVEAAKVTACERCPNHTFLVDIGSANAKARQWDIIDFRERGLGWIGPGRNPHHRSGEAPEGAPDRAIRRVRHYRIKAGRNSLVLRWIHRLVWFHVRVTLAVAVGVQDHWRPSLRFGRIAGRIEDFHVEPTNDLPPTTGPQPVIGVKL